jgi:hypothetical protein
MYIYGATVWGHAGMYGMPSTVVDCLVRTQEDLFAVFILA